MSGSGATAPAMVERLGPADAPVPVVFDSPHSGRYYPPDFGAVAPVEELMGAEDRFVDELIAGATEHGVAVIAAGFARSYLDPNRRNDDIDPAILDGPWPTPLQPSYKSEMGVGLIFTRLPPDTAIYDRKLGVAEVEKRISRCWRPYHEALQARLDAVHARHRGHWHINFHSMTATGTALSPDPGMPRPDFVLGDLHGTSCDGAFTEFVAESLAGMGYSVAVNDPYAGAELVERHGNPAQARHSLQIEINRKLYMDAGDLEKHEGFETLRGDLTHLAAAVCGFARKTVQDS